MHNSAALQYSDYHILACRWCKPENGTSDSEYVIGRFFTRSGKVIVPLAVREILDEQIAMKLA